jgi:hypothetical protein
VSLYLHALGIVESAFLVWSLQEEGAQEASPRAQQQTCVRAITVGGLDNVIDVRNALSEHLNVIVSTNIVKCALHEACFGSLEKLKKPLLMGKNVCYKLEFA